MAVLQSLWYRHLFFSWVFSSARLERQTVNLDVGGSNPSRPVTLLGNIITKAVTKIVLITKNEMEYLTKVKGIPFGYEGISHTYGHNRTYYLCEKYKKLLENYRKSRIVEK